MKHVMRVVGLVLLLLLVGAACSSTDGALDPAAHQPIANTEPLTGDATSPDPVGGSDDAEPGLSLAVGPGISVAEALTSDLSQPLLVNGFIVTDAEGTVFLAESLAESFPPQAGGAKLIVEGLDLTLLEGMTNASGISWTDQPVQVLGTVQNGVLTVAVTASA